MTAEEREQVALELADLRIQLIERRQAPVLVTARHRRDQWLNATLREIARLEQLLQEDTA